MKIGIVNDYIEAGGAEETNQYLKTFLEDKGLVVENITCEHLSITCDKYLIVNFRSFHPSSLDLLLKKDIIYMPRDLIPYRSGLEEYVNKIYNKARRVFFLSPLFMREFTRLYMLNSHKKGSDLYVPGFDINKYEAKEDREDKVCWSCT